MSLVSGLAFGTVSNNVRLAAVSSLVPLLMLTLSCSKRADSATEKACVTLQGFSINRAHGRAVSVNSATAVMLDRDIQEEAAGSSDPDIRNAAQGVNDAVRAGEQQGLTDAVVAMEGACASAGYISH